MSGSEKKVDEKKQFSRKQKVEEISPVDSHLLETERSGHGLRTHGHVLGMLRSSENGRQSLQVILRSWTRPTRLLMLTHVKRLKCLQGFK